MATRSKAPRFENLAEMLDQLGDIDPARVRASPPPGRATERDLIRINDRTGRLCELVDGVLVEKVMGFAESALTITLARLLGTFIAERDLGFLAGPDGPVRLLLGLVRLPDLSFVSWKQLPRREIPREPIADLAPDLAVEVLSASNTRSEMERKLREYFLAGVRLAWLVDLDQRTAEIFTGPDQSVLRTEDQTLDGGDVLPGFALPLRDLFAGLGPAPAGKRKRSRKRKPPRRGS